MSTAEHSFGLPSAAASPVGRAAAGGTPACTAPCDTPLTMFCHFALWRTNLTSLTACRLHELHSWDQPVTLRGKRAPGGFAGPGGLVRRAAVTSTECLVLGRDVSAHTLCTHPGHMQLPHKFDYRLWSQDLHLRSWEGAPNSLPIATCSVNGAGYRARVASAKPAPLRPAASPNLATNIIREPLTKLMPRLNAQRLGSSTDGARRIEPTPAVAPPACRAAAASKAWEARRGLHGPSIMRARTRARKSSSPGAGSPGQQGWSTLHRDPLSQCFAALLAQADVEGTQVVRSWAAVLSVCKTWRALAREVRFSPAAAQSLLPGTVWGVWQRRPGAIGAHRAAVKGREPHSPCSTPSPRSRRRCPSTWWPRPARSCWPG